MTVIRKPDDVAGLVPSFRAKVDQLLARLTARGYAPVVVDGGRTAAEAEANEAKGTGKANSMHMWGVAADLADRRTGWSDPEFFAALGEEAKALGLCWGGDWAKPDRPHVQAVPATAKAQAAVRKLAKDDVAAIDAVCRKYLRS